jgi:hypothetical protein
MLEVQYHCRTDNVRSKNLKEVIANLKQGLWSFNHEFRWLS